MRGRHAVIMKRNSSLKPNLNISPVAADSRLPMTLLLLPGRKKLFARRFIPGILFLLHANYGRHSLEYFQLKVQRGFATVENQFEQPVSGEMVTEIFFRKPKNKFKFFDEVPIENSKGNSMERG